MAITTKRNETGYDVLEDGVKIGTVEKYERRHHVLSGRISVGVEMERGWRAKGARVPGGKHDIYRGTKKDAVTLVATGRSW